MPSSVRISGFTLLRNGVEFDYPFEESIRSLLPLVDELVINVGRGTDSTLTQLQSLQAENPKIKLFESDWGLNDPEKKKGGQILSTQTNLALDRCLNDWCVYLQADEVFHEEDLTLMRSAMERSEKNPAIDGLLFEYIHLYGSYDVYQNSRSVYRREVRAIKKSSGCRSIGDAQSFRKPDGSKPNVILSGARVFHYGWVRKPEAMKAKTYFMDSLYHGDPTAEAAATQTPFTGDNYRYKKFWGLWPYKGSHPKVMHARIKKQGWHWDLKASLFEWKASDLKKVVLDTLERVTGRRFFEYRSYRIFRG